MHEKYKRMIAGMVKKEKAKRRGKKRPKEAPWFLYLLECVDGSLYTGVTNNIDRRFEMHQKGKASRYTRTRRPVALRYQEKVGSRAQALVREWKVKTFSKKKKHSLIASSKKNKSKP